MKVYSSLICCIMLFAGSFAFAASDEPAFEHTSTSAQTELLDDPESFVTTAISIEAISDEEEVMFLQLDELLELPLRPSSKAKNVWEGLYLDNESEFHPGVTVELSRTGGGEWTALLTVGWTNPVQLQFTMNKDGVLEFDGKRDCKCSNKISICTAQKCNNGNSCYGAIDDTCKWYESAENQFTGWLELEVDVIDFMFFD